MKLTHKFNSGIGALVDEHGHIVADHLESNVADQIVLRCNAFEPMKEALEQSLEFAKHYCGPWEAIIRVALSKAKAQDGK